MKARRASRIAEMEKPRQKIIFSVLVAVVSLSGCGYNIIPSPPQNMPSASEKSLPLRVAVRDMQIVDAPQPEIDEKSKELAAALRQSHLFKDVKRLGQGGNWQGYDAVITASYKDETDQSGIGFVFPPCLIPFVDFCIIPLGKVSIALQAELHLTISDGAGQAVKSYAETPTATCEYVPFPGLFPFNLALIGPDVSCHVNEGPNAAFQMGLAKIISDLIGDRDSFKDFQAQNTRVRAAMQEQRQSDDNNAPVPASAPAQKPWWQQ
ncbi:MAG: hypothetical protein ACYCPQ_07920 [Elusimicrobiota bacterium]